MQDNMYFKRRKCYVKIILHDKQCKTFHIIKRAVFLRPSVRGSKNRDTRPFVCHNPSAIRYGKNLTKMRIDRSKIFWG